MIRSARPRWGAGGFTLVELILVLAVLTIVLSSGAPALSRFFRGRTLDSEARRFLSLTRYGQSRAVSEGIPMVLWIDAEQGLYGLNAEPGHLDVESGGREVDDSRAVEFTLHDDLQIEVEQAEVRTLARQYDVPTPRTDRLPEIRFTPDGFFSETSPDAVFIRERDDREERGVWIAQNWNRSHYELQTNHVHYVRR
jgi:prepilin-type N-terminal cleavage/methylation domain-containing protein